MKIAEKVCIVILNWNGWTDTIECLESIFRQDYSTYQVVVCDNNSHDESLEKIKAWAEGSLDTFSSKDNSLYHLYSPPANKPIPYVEYQHQIAELGGNSDKKNLPLVLIRIEENLGFTGGNNVGIRFALANNATYIWVLNNDTLVSRNCLNEMIFTIESNSNIGIVGSKIYFAHTKNLIWFAGAKFNRYFGQSIMTGFSKVDDEKSWEIDVEAAFITGCSMLIKTEVLHKIGLLDDDYFFGMEDLDFGIRVRNVFLRCVVSRKAKLWHKVSNSTGGMDSPIYIYYYLRNRLLLMKKHGNLRILPTFILHFFCLSMIKYITISIIRRRSYNCYVAMYYALRDFLMGKVGRLDIVSEKYLCKNVYF
jgi:GT2 family glycosyltransferase